MDEMQMKMLAGALRYAIDRLEKAAAFAMLDNALEAYDPDPLHRESAVMQIKIIDRTLRRKYGD